jgi:hypothetical protein
MTPADIPAIAVVVLIALMWIIGAAAETMEHHDV